MVNKVILVGNLTRDAESLTSSRGPVARMRLATSHHWRDAEGNRHEGSEFHNLVAFSRLAEICATYCLKGRRIYAEGRLRTREYDGSDGLRRTSTEVVLDVMRLLDRREDAGSGADLAGPDIALQAIDLHAAVPAEEDGDESRLALSGAGAH